MADEKFSTSPGLDFHEWAGVQQPASHSASNSAPQTPSPTEQPIPRYDYASGKVEYVLRGLFYDSREEALACNKQRMPQMSGRREE